MEEPSSTNEPVVINNDFVIQLLTAPNDILALLAGETAYNHLAYMAGVRCDADMPGVAFLVDGEEGVCDPYHYSNPSCLVFAFFEFSYEDHEKTMYFAVGSGIGGEWQMSTKCLLLPKDDPDEWGTDEEAATQRGIHILRWLADLCQNRQWRPLNPEA